ncbi:hypothetical protein B0H11DRAFT_1255589 [Mycena galericulata]|nr:hypothetical protein B0H11DRAFT_1255589 [Mycena galericulata]
MEEVHTLLYALIKLLMKSNIGGALPPAISNHIRDFIETLENIRSFLESRQDKRKIKHSSRQLENNALLEVCRAGLLEAFGAFKAHRTLINPQQRHEELLQFLSPSPVATTRSAAFTRSETSFSPPKSNGFASPSYIQHGASSYLGTPPVRSDPQSFNLARKPSLKHIVDVVARKSVRTAYWVSSRFQADHRPDY